MPSDSQNPPHQTIAEEPRGELRIVETRLAEKQKIAIYVTIVLEDEAGQIWAFDVSSFRFDLKRNEAHAGW